MFCRKCGVKILDDSVFCPECGEKVETIIKTAVADFALEKNDDTSISSKEKETEDNIAETAENDTSHEYNGTAHSTEKNNSKTIIITISAISVVVLLIVIIFSALKNGQCEYYKDCSNKKANGTDYCYSHLCDYSDCTASKGYSSNFCYAHQCSYTLCDNRVLTGSKYCSTHTCSVDGCYNEVEVNSENCSEHQIDMRNKLSPPSMYFSLNSAGGIKFSFSATNRSGKTIKYVRFNAYLKNAVGDPIQEDISNDYYADVEIIGPISNGETVRLSSEIIGYCDNLARIDVRDITLVYTDGSSETGSYNYYCN